nr:DUF1427 family protein [Burkholderia sp. M701]
MKAYLLSLAAGALVGLLYSVMNVKSPAPTASYADGAKSR